MIVLKKKISEAEGLDPKIEAAIWQMIEAKTIPNHPIKIGDMEVYFKAREDRDFVTVFPVEIDKSGSWTKRFNFEAKIEYRKGIVIPR